MARESKVRLKGEVNDIVKEIAEIKVSANNVSKVEVSAFGNYYVD